MKLQAGLLLLQPCPDFWPTETLEQVCDGFGKCVNGLLGFDKILIQTIPSK